MPWLGAAVLALLALQTTSARADERSAIGSRISLTTRPALQLDLAPLTPEPPEVRSASAIDRRLLVRGQDRPTATHDERRARQGAFMMAAGMPLAVTGTATWILGAALPQNNYCGDPNKKRETMLAGGAMSVVGIGFSSGAIVAWRRTTHEARRARSRRTRAGVAVTALISSAIGMAILTTFSVNALCLAS